MEPRDNQRGQGLVEMAMIVLLFIGLILGVMTFGHAFMVANMITHAARDGARLAATWPNRGNCGAIINYTALLSKVQSEIASVVGGTFNVAVTQNPTPAGAPPCGASPTTPSVRVTVTGCVPYVFPILPANLGANCNGRKGFTVNRTVELYDEGPV